VKIESQIGELKLKAVYHDIVIGDRDQAFFSIPSRRTPLEEMYQVA